MPLRDITPAEVYAITPPLPPGEVEVLFDGQATLTAPQIAASGLIDDYKAHVLMRLLGDLDNVTSFGVGCRDETYTHGPGLPPQAAAESQTQADWAVSVPPPPPLSTDVPTSLTTGMALGFDAIHTCVLSAPSHTPAVLAARVNSEYSRQIAHLVVLHAKEDVA